MKPLTIFFSLILLINAAALSAQNCNNPRVSAEFSLLNNDICEGSQITIQNTTNENNNPNVVYTMNWGDGTIDTVSSRDNISHIYNLSEFNACGTAVDVGMDLRLDAFVPGCESNNHHVSKPVFVRFLPRPQITGTDLLCFPDTELQFGNATCPSGDDVTYEWDFDDPASGANNTSTEKTPTHIFSGIGTYNVKLTTRNGCGERSIEREIQVLNSPVAEATIAPRDGGGFCAPMDLVTTNRSQFIDRYEWEIRGSRDWSFTDDTDRLDAEPVFRILEAGEYTIELKGFGCGQAIWDTTITVNSPPLVRLDSIGNNCNEIRINPSEIVTYGGGEVNEYTWAFPGQSLAASSEALPDTVLVYETVNQFNIQVSVSNECGVDSDEIFFAVDSIRVVNISPAGPLCSADSPVTLQATPANGVWQIHGPPSNIGQFDPGQAMLGQNPVSYTFGSGDCAVSDTIEIEVNGTLVDAGPDQTICADEAPFTLAPNSSPTGYWQGSIPGLIDSAGLFTPELAEGGSNIVQYVVQDPASGCIDIDERIVNISALPEAVLGDITGGCVGVPIPFENNTAGISSSFWRFGDGGTSTELSPIHTYNSRDTFQLSLAVTTSDGCRDTIYQEMAISEPVSAAFTMDQSSGCAELVVNIENNSSGDADIFEWYLGDSLYSNAFNPEPLRLSPIRQDSTYNLELRVLSGCNNESALKEILVFAKPVASFGTLSTNYCSGERVAIGNNSIADSLFWDFGNGQTFTGDRPPIQYFFTEEVYDTFTINLFAFNGCGVDTLQKDIIIMPTDAEAFISMGDRVACVNTPILFESFSIPREAPVEWDFGDGNTAAGAQVSHAFQESGVYEITARVSSCGFDSLTVPIEIRPAPNLDLDLPEYVCRDDTARIALSSDAAQHIIYFGDGDSTFLNQAAHVYDSAAVYPVTATAVSFDGCIATASLPLSVLAPPVPGILLERDSVCAGEPLRVRNDNPSLECQWDFGDGNFMVGCVADHPYRNAGTYSLALIATDSLGCRERSSRPIYIRELPVPDFGFSLIDSCGQGRVQFDNRSFKAEAYRWNFGDGNNSQETDPLQSFAGSGVYDVRLEAVTAAGCSQTINRPVEIYVQPTAIIDIPDSVGCAPFDLPFSSGDDLPGLNAVWDFSGGAVSFEPEVNHQYPEAGSFPVRLIVYTEHCADTSYREITVHPPLELIYTRTFNDCFGDAEAEIDVTITSGLEPVAFSWSNGERTEDLQGLMAGVYTLDAMDANGCQISENISIVQPENPISIDVLEDIPISCYGLSDGSMTVIARGGNPNYTYEWSNGAKGVSLVNVAAETYELTVTDSRNCTFVAQLPIGNKDPLAITPSIQAISCFGEDDGVVELQIQGGTPPYFNMLSGQGLQKEGDRFDGLKPGDYNIMILDNQGCQEEFSATILEPPLVTVDIIPSDTTLRLGYQMPLPIRHNQMNPDIQWTPDRYLDLNDPMRPITFPFRDQVYVAIVTNEDGCSASDTIRIKVESDRDVFIPNAFSPDNDGHNDVFTVRTDAVSKTITQINYMQIYDRWGELVFEQRDFQPNDYDMGWNGVFKGSLLPPEIYFYAIEIQYVDKEEPIRFQGDVRLFY